MLSVYCTSPLLLGKRHSGHAMVADCEMAHFLFCNNLLESILIPPYYCNDFNISQISICFFFYFFTVVSSFISIESFCVIPLLVKLYDENEDDDDDNWSNEKAKLDCSWSSGVDN